MYVQVLLFIGNDMCSFFPFEAYNLILNKSNAAYTYRYVYIHIDMYIHIDTHIYASYVYTYRCTHICISQCFYLEGVTRALSFHWRLVFLP